MSRKVCRVLSFLILFCVASLSAQAQIVEVTVKKADLTSSPSPLRTPMPVDGVRVVIHCDEVDCAKLTALVGGADATLEPDAPNVRGVDVTKDQIKKSSDVVIQSTETSNGKKRSVAIVRFTTRGADTDPVGHRFAECGDIPLHNYDAANNRAYFEVTSDGSMISRPDISIDENDVVVVQVNDTLENLAKIKVVRKSATRRFVQNTAGSGEVIKMAGSDEIGCKEFTLGDFSPSAEGQVEIADKTNGNVLGSFTFKVNPLYTGILSFGPTWTGQTGEQSFTVIKKGDKNVIAAAEEGKRSILYAVNYTYYWRGPRDLEKPLAGSLLGHINPTLGISMKKTSDHAFAGLSVDAGDFLFTVGIHFAHQTQLSASSGLKPGSEFAGTTAEIPLAKRWDSHAYFGISINLRAATELLKSITQ